MGGAGEIVAELLMLILLGIIAGSAVAALHARHSQ
jgi:hypothetical protein